MNYGLQLGPDAASAKTVNVVNFSADDLGAMIDGLFKGDPTLQVIVVRKMP